MYNLRYLSSQPTFSIRTADEQSSIKDTLISVINKYKFQDNNWVYRQQIYTSQQIANAVFNTQLPCTLNDLTTYIKLAADNYAVVVPQDSNDDMEQRNAEWLLAYRDNLLLGGFSAIDKFVWSGFKYTLNMGSPLIVGPTGNGNEYKQIGRTWQEINAALAVLTVEQDGQKINRIKYIDQHIIQPLLCLCSSNAPTPIAFLDGAKLPASVADALYKPVPVKDDDHNVIGFKFVYTVGKPTVAKYIELSLEAFLADPDNYIPDISPISNDSEEPTYRYINLNPAHGDWSAYRKWFVDTFDDYESAQQIYMGWVGAALTAKNTSKQVLWVYGGGDDGKSTVASTLIKYFGEAGTGTNVHDITQDHGISGIVNKRLLVFSDDKNQRLIQTPIIHKITGGDTVTDNPKHQTPRAVKMIGKIMVCDNKLPLINMREQNQTSRLILLQCKTKTDEEKIASGIAVRTDDGRVQMVGNSEFKRTLETQTEAFCAACLDVYKTVCPTDAQILVPESAVLAMRDHCADNDEANIDECIDDLLVATTVQDAYIITTDLYSKVAEKLGKGYNSVYTPAAVQDLLKKVYKSEIKQIRIDGVRKRVYPGIKYRSAEPATWTPGMGAPTKPAPIGIDISKFLAVPKPPKTNTEKSNQNLDVSAFGNNFLGQPENTDSALGNNYWGPKENMDSASAFGNNFLEQK